MSKNSCPLCRQQMHDPRTIFRNECLSSSFLQGKFLLEPLKDEWGVVQCNVKCKSLFGVTRLTMYSDDSGLPLLEARRLSTSTMFAPEYGIFANDQKVASLSANMLGTVWTLKAGKKELLCVQYSLNRAWMKGPRKMKLLCPAVDMDGKPIIQHRPRGKKGSLSNLITAPNVPFGFDTFNNRAPQWDENLASYCLNFGGRVRLASVKNFQIMFDHKDWESETLVQFGRIGKNHFNLDVQFPFSPLQAFAVSVSSYYEKLGVE